MSGRKVDDARAEVIKGYLSQGYPTYSTTAVFDLLSDREADKLEIERLRSALERADDYIFDAYAAVQLGLRGPLKPLPLPESPAIASTPQADGQA